MGRRNPAISAARRFSLQPAPHRHSGVRLDGVMREVLLALLPGMAMLVLTAGPGVLFQAGIAVAAAWLAEAAILRLRRRPVLSALADQSATVTGLLLAVAIPPTLPAWQTAFGAAFAIIFAKQLYGGLGANPFNPAMVGYAVLLVSFPKTMTTWLNSPADLATTLQAIFGGGADLQAWAGATPLDSVRTRLGLGEGWEAIAAAGLPTASVWVNLGFLLGGLWLLRRGIINWRIPGAFLASLFAAALLSGLFSSAPTPGPLFHCLHGATMLGAFFIATDPVSAATTPRGRLIYGAGIGLLVFLIRAVGGYPDGVAFAVLLMNAAVPLIERYTRPRVFGESP